MSEVRGVARWTVHPARRRPIAACIALIVIAGAAVLGARALEQDWLAVLFALALCGSVSDFLLPTTYELDEEGIRVRHLFTSRRRERAQIRRVEMGTRAALLSPFDRPRRLDRFRALVVPLHGAPPEAVDRLRRWSEGPGRSPEAPGR